MLNDITLIDLKIMSLFIKDYARTYSIRGMTKQLNINYPNAFKRVKLLVKQRILIEKKEGQVNHISLNMNNIHALQLLSFVEEQESQRLENSSLKLLVQEVIKAEPFACVGLFGSRVSGKAKKESDWDVFIICRADKARVLEKIMAKFPHNKNIQIQVLPIDEFWDSLLTAEETVVKHIVRNKQIIYNPHPFYSTIYNLEMVKYAPSS